MAVELAVALGKVEQAALHVFDADPTVRSVGVGRSGDGYGFVAVRNVKAILPMGAMLGAVQLPRQFDGIPVEYVSTHRDPTQLVRLPHSGPGSPGVGSIVPEQLFHRPALCGLQLQNFDDDIRTGVIAGGHMIVGTLGCFVISGGNIAILSNNHVLAGENRGVKGTDRILQAGGAAFSATQHVATLTDFVALRPSPVNASIAAGTVILNDADAAIATLEAGVAHTQGYLPTRSVAAPHGIASPAVGDIVYKVGRTTGLTHGTVKQIGVVLGPVPYDPGMCWFRQSIVVEGNDGTTFSDHGDSGSAIVRNDGMVVGLLYAGNGTQTYACDIGIVLNALGCQLA